MNRAVFIDRDGTLCTNVPYLGDPSLLSPVEGVFEALRELKGRGFLLVVVTNQSGVARGAITENALGRVNDAMVGLFSAERAEIDGVYFCPHHPDFPAGAGSPCTCRKPEAGMLLKAAADLEIDLSRSFMVGDSPTDVQAGKNAGCRTVLLLLGDACDAGAPGGRPDHVAASWEDAAEWITRVEEQ